MAAPLQWQVLALGPANLARVGIYRLLVRFGRHPVQKLTASAPSGPFFSAPEASGPVWRVARQTWRENALYFSWFQSPLEGRRPDWLGNAFDPEKRSSVDRPWWQISDFNEPLGDIKAIWEASRFDWLLAMAQRAALSDPAGKNTDLARLNDWLEDWSSTNPPYSGPNWKCGQEASIRVMHLALAALILGDWRHPSPGLTALLRNHLRRIAPTLAYALGQQNNHGTSEAAALFIGGTWLERIGCAEGARWARTGRRWLENRARVLIMPDGTFSQYSVVYHRVLLDTYALAEAWRRRLGLVPFSDRLKNRIVAAVDWLRHLTDAQSGDAPNIGANDGARLIALTDTPYRDFRPSVQLAAALFANAKAWGERGDWDQPLAWLGLPSPESTLPTLQSRSFDSGGFHVLRQPRALAVLRYPRFRFRPSQADALHLDVWVDGINLVRDGGSYSYNVSDSDTSYFNGAPAHSLVEVDGRDQMPKLSRFLFGAWLRASHVDPVHEEGGAVRAGAGYRDHLSAEVKRAIILKPDSLVCHDVVGGTARTAVLRWRLAPSDWTLSDGVATNGAFRIEIEASTSLAHLTLTEGQESRYYLRKTALPVLEMRVTAPCVLTTRVTF